MSSCPVMDRASVADVLRFRNRTILRIPRKVAQRASGNCLRARIRQFTINRQSPLDGHRPGFDVVEEACLDAAGGALIGVVTRPTWWPPSGQSGGGCGPAGPNRPSVPCQLRHGSGSDPIQMQFPIYWIGIRLKHYRFGPLEWMLRRFVYGKMMPAKNSNKKLTEAVAETM